ncbi:tyrosine-type recombinase/integrase [Mariniflexile sp. AS56]|uniref:tyrosine-type recombinase/integrase n=1 Tax=Mariniflexile sp. AS56 TaxID=3063957 RepID=UPI0026ED561B|nr:site-specific integrase [Mariniflexile sp. AS56]MDO7174263.1 site-specific integrase [Mariniflexile sp. AS56]
MSTLNELVTFENQNEYESAYDLSIKRNFSPPKIYNANGDLKKRWYIYFSFRDPKSGKLKRITPFYGNANKYKTKEERLSVLVTYRKVLLKLLKQGYNPYADNTELYHQLQAKETVKKTLVLDQKQNNTPKAIEEIPAMTLQEAFDFGLKQKEKIVNSTTKRGYDNRVKKFLEWIQEHRPEVQSIKALNKKVFIAFLNDMLSKTSARNRNNYRADLSSILQVLEDNDIVDLNFIKQIPVLKSIPERNKTYSNQIQEDIFEYLEKKDPILLLYIKFISYNFLRPIEVSRLTVGDINVKDRTIRFKAKNSPLKTKIIPELLWVELPDLAQFNKEAVLFTPEEIGGAWETEINNRRDYFSKRFKKVVKDHFNLGKDYGLYSFRHTYITKLYRALMVDSSPFEAKSKLMLITGHSSMTALEKYLRDIDAELPADYSAMLKNTHG